MRKQTSFLVLVELLLVAAVSLPVAGVASAKTNPGPANQIVIRAQETNGTNQILVDSVTAAQDGWIVIYTDPCIRRCAIVGYAPVHRGQNTHFTADIDSSTVEPFPTLWAVLHVDQGVIGLLEWPGPDEPVLQDGKPVMVAFATQAPPQPGPTAKIVNPSKGYAKLQADFRIYNWRKSDTPGDLIGALQVYATGGGGHYTYGFIGLRTTDTFDFRWRACSVLVETLHVWSGDGQEIAVPVWRTDLPCPKNWDTYTGDCDCHCGCNCNCGCGCDCNCGCGCDCP